VAVPALPGAEPVQEVPPDTAVEPVFSSAACNATVPPWSAAHPYTNLYGPKAPEKFITATVAGNLRVTEVGSDYDTHHIVLDFGSTPFPVLEGQSIGIIPPGVDAHGRAHHPRQYSIASRATASDPATTTSRSPSSGCSRITRAGRCAAWHRTTCAT